MSMTYHHRDNAQALIIKNPKHRNLLTKVREKDARDRCRAARKGVWDD
jgi:hypothetical protein